MPGCRRCRYCSGYVEKDFGQKVFTKLGGGAFNSCAICQCYKDYHYWKYFWNIK